MDHRLLRARSDACHRRNCASIPVIANAIGRPLTPEQVSALGVRTAKMHCATHLREAHRLQQDEMISDLLAAAAVALGKCHEDQPDLEFDDLTLAPDTPEQGSTIAPDHEQDAEPVSATTEGDTGPGPGELFPAATSDPPAINPDQEREIDLSIANARAISGRKKR